MATTVKELNEIVETQAKEITALKENQTALISTVEVLETNLQKLQVALAPKPTKEKVDTPAVPTETFKVDGEEYKFTKPTYRTKSGDIVPSKDALDSPAELEWLVTVGASNVAKA